MDTQSNVTVTALSTIRHGAEGKGITEYNAGDTIEVTLSEARELLALKVVEASDQVNQEVDKLDEAREKAAAEQEAPDTAVSDNTATTQADGTVTNVQTTATGPSPADIETTLNSVELQ